MGRVNISGNLLLEVQEKVNRMCQKAVEEALPKEPLPAIDPQYAMDCLWGDKVHLVAQYQRLVPKLMRTIDYSDTIHCNTVRLIPNGDGFKKVGMRVTSIQPARRQKFLCPPEISNYGSVEVHIPPTHPAAVEVLRRHKIEMEVRDKYKVIGEQLRSFLGRCKSLNEAVKIMPEITLYINSETKARLEKKVDTTRQNREAATTEGVDVDTLVATAIGHRIGATS